MRAGVKLDMDQLTLTFSAIFAAGCREGGPRKGPVYAPYFRRIQETDYVAEMRRTLKRGRNRVSIQAT